MEKASKVFILITGASRGYGTALARAAAKSFDCPVDFLLLARNIDGLQQCKTLIEETRHENFPEKDFSVKTEQVDLRDLNASELLLTSIFDEVKAGDYARGMCFLNAGTVGYVGNFQDIPDIGSMKGEVDLNVTSPLWLASKFVSIFGATRSDEEEENATKKAKVDEANTETKQDVPVEQVEPPSFLVNISSLCAIEPFATMATYCFTRAAKEMAMRVISKEQEHSNKLKVLNWAPGPMATDMIDEIVASKALDPDIRAYYEKLLQENSCVPQDASAEKCMRILITNSFYSGAHIDYFDEV